MDIISIIGIAIALCFDSYAASVSCGLNCQRFTWEVKLLIPLSFAIFQSVFPLIGYFFGHQLLPYIESWDHWLAFALLFLIGGNMIRESLKKEEERKPLTISVRLILGMSVATSIDALAAGFSLGLLEMNIWYTALVIFLFTYGASAFGLMTGKRFQSERFQRWAAALGGLILIGIGAKVAFTHALEHGFLS